MRRVALAGGESATSRSLAFSGLSLAFRILFSAYGRSELKHAYFDWIFFSGLKYKGRNAALHNERAERLLPPWEQTAKCVL